MREHPMLPTEGSAEPTLPPPVAGEERRELP
jgi:hypothetical protein